MSRRMPMLRRARRAQAELLETSLVTFPADGQARVRRVGGTRLRLSAAPPIERAAYGSRATHHLPETIAKAEAASGAAASYSRRSKRATESVGRRWARGRSQAGRAGRRALEAARCDRRGATRIRAAEAPRPSQTTR